MMWFAKQKLSAWQLFSETSSQPVMLLGSPAAYTWIGGILGLSVMSFLSSGTGLTPRLATVNGACSPSAEEVRTIINHRCMRCHSSKTAGTGESMAAAGIVFDTNQAVLSRAKHIFSSAVEFRTMPPSNITGMTEGERNLLARWYAALVNSYPE